MSKSAKSGPAAPHSVWTISIAAMVTLALHHRLVMCALAALGGLKASPVCATAPWRLQGQVGNSFPGADSLAGSEPAQSESAQNFHFKFKSSDDAHTPPGSGHGWEEYDATNADAVKGALSRRQASKESKTGFCADFYVEAQNTHQILESPSGGSYSAHHLRAH